MIRTHIIKKKRVRVVESRFFKRVTVPELKNNSGATKKKCVYVGLSKRSREYARTLNGVPTHTL